MREAATTTDGLDEGAEEDLLRHLGLGAADLVQQVVGLVGDQEGVGQNEHEAAGESPGEVRVLSRIDVECAGEFPQRPGRFVRLGQPAIVQRDREEQDEEPADRARGQEHGELVAGEQLDHEGAAHRRDRRTDTQDTGDQAALSGRDLVGQHRHHGGEQCVEEQLGDAPSDEDHRDAGGQRDNEDAEGTADQADDHPGPPHAQPRRGAVAHLAEERIAEHGQQGADPGDKRQAVRCPFDPHQRVDLQRQGDQQGRDEQQGGAHVRQRVQRDETPSDPVRRGRLRLQRSLGCGSVLQSVQPGGGRQTRAGGGGAVPGTGNVGHCALLRRHRARRSAYTTCRHTDTASGFAPCRSGVPRRARLVNAIPARASLRWPRPESWANGQITTSITTRGDASSSHSLLPFDQPATSETPAEIHPAKR